MNRMINRENVSIKFNRELATGVGSRRSANRPYILRGDLYYADLSPVVGSEQGGVRPVLVIQNDVGNKFSPTVIVAAITSRTTKAVLPTHVSVPGSGNGLKQDSVILVEQIRTIDRNRLKEYIGHLGEREMAPVERAMVISLGLGHLAEGL